VLQIEPQKSKNNRPTKTKLEATCIVDHAIDQSNASPSEPRVFNQFVCRFLLAFSRDFLLFGSLRRDFELGLYWDLKLIGFLNVDGRWSLVDREPVRSAYYLFITFLRAGASANIPDKL